MKSLAPAAVLLALLHSAVPARAGADIVDSVKGLRPARVIVADGPQSPAPSDPRLNSPYAYLCFVEIEENGEFVRRFNLHAPDPMALAQARQAGKMLALLWGAANARFGTLSTRLRSEVDVWFTRGGEPGGEQLDTSLYINDVGAERTGIEWARELAHEYGHYLLPGASGYTAPENWSNGVLGERLFLKWLGDDVAHGGLDAREIPYITAANLADYRAKQVSPLIKRIMLRGVDATVIAGRDRRAMDAFTGVMLYSDQVYGGRSLLDMLIYLAPGRAASATGPDFLAAFRAMAARAPRPRIDIPESGSAMVYLGKGRYRFGRTAMVDGVPCAARSGGFDCRIGASGWHVVKAAPGRPMEIRRTGDL